MSGTAKGEDWVNAPAMWECYRKAKAFYEKEGILLPAGPGPQDLSLCPQDPLIDGEQMVVPSGKMHELCRGLHAEQNAIIQAACLGHSIEGATLYCTTQPCVICTKMIINAGIKRVVIKETYPDELAQQMAKEAGLIIDVIDDKQ